MTIKFCLNCNKKMSRKEKEQLSYFKKRKYCDQKCYHSNTNHVRNEKDFSGQTINNLLFIKHTKNTSSGNKIYLIKCHCGNFFETRPNRIVKNTTTSCGCLQKKLFSERSKLQVGKNHPNWISDRSALKQTPSHRYLKGYSVWSLKIFERDNFTCRVCNKRGGNLNAHHLDSWDWCINRRFDIENGITLCEFHHREFHNLYGYGKNTSEEFIEYFLIKG